MLMRKLTYFGLLWIWAGCAAASYPFPYDPPPVSVLTQRYNPQRTGTNTDEHILTVESVSSSEFQRLYSIALPGQVYAQPILAAGVAFSDGTKKNVLVVATMTNTVQAYAVDDALHGPASQPLLLWSVSLGSAIPANFMPMAASDYGCFFQVFCWPHTDPPSTPKPLAPIGTSSSGILSSGYGLYNINPSIGIVSTPVIDPAWGQVFLVAKTVGQTGAPEHHLVRLDLRTGNVTGTIVVGSGVSLPSSAEDSQNGVLTFNQSRHMQRPALLLQRENIYVAFGSHQDSYPFHGWIFAYDEHTLALSAVWCSTQNDMGGGIWQAGSGLVGDDRGNVYVMTGNGSPNGNPPDAAVGNFADTFVQLNSSLVPVGSFAPSDDPERDSKDIDLGSAGPLILPGMNLILGGDKEARFFVLDASNRMTSRQIFQAGNQRDALSIAGSGYHHIHGTPAVWRSDSLGLAAYFMGERDTARAYRWDDVQGAFTCSKAPGGCSNSATSMADMQSGMYSSTCYGCMPGGIVSISAEAGNAGTGLLWLATPFNVTGDNIGGYNTIVGGGLNNVVPGVLHAFNAEDLTQDLWNSEANAARDGFFMFAKFNPPVVANGRVYLATFGTSVGVTGTQSAAGTINIYGLRQWAKILGYSIAPPAGSVPAGTTFTLVLNLLNPGITTWKAGQYFLSASRGWGTTRINLPNDIGPGGQVALLANFTAPTTVSPSNECNYSGRCRLILQMTDGVNTFGEVAASSISVSGLPLACSAGEQCCGTISSDGTCVSGCVPDSTVCQPACPPPLPFCCGTDRNPNGTCAQSCATSPTKCPSPL